jgi:AraC-like DNA-binding protein
MHQLEMSDLPYHHDWKPQLETSLGLQVKWFGRWGDDPDWSVVPSRLASDLICFFYLEKGQCEAVVNGVSVSLRPGELLVLRGGDVFSFSQHESKYQTSLSACLSLHRGDSSNVLLHHAYERHYRLNDRKSYERRFRDVLAKLDTQSRWRNLHVSAAVIHWLAELQETLGPAPSSSDGDTKVTHHVLAAQEWVQQRLHDNITVADWAAACHLNVDYFSRLFKAHTGMTPRAWLVERRLQRASQLLANPDETIEEVAYQCGFNCPFHFSRRFKARFSMPPSSYRRVRQVRGFVDE